MKKAEITIHGRQFDNLNGFFRHFQARALVRVVPGGVGLRRECPTILHLSPAP